MQFTTVALTLLAAIGTTTAAALPAPAVDAAEVADASHYHWHISGFGYGCSPGGCSAEGTIHGAAHKGAPAFTAKCSATSYDKDFVKCKGKDGDDVKFWFHQANHGLIVHFRHKAHGKTFKATKHIPDPPYQKTVHFNMKPRQK